MAGVARTVHSRLSRRRRDRCAQWLLIALLCAVTPPSFAASDTANQTGGTLTARAADLILVTVDNPIELPLTTAGSIPRGTERVGGYTIARRARVVSRALARTYHLSLVREWPIATLQVHCLVFALPADADRAALLRRLAADARVRVVQPLQVFAALSDPPNSDPAYNDPYFALQRGFAAINAAAAQRWSSGQGVSVAVIDTGVDTDHPDLAGRVQVVRNFVDEDSGQFRSDRHGTAIAGIIGALANNGLGIVGVAPAANLQVYKACAASAPATLAASCNSFTLALALSAAIESHAQIVNLSLGGPADALLTQLVEFGQQRGMVFVGAMPANHRRDGFPLSVPGVVAVDAADHATPDASSGVLYAPGNDVLSLSPGGHYDFVSGSSFAAAHVSAALAVLRAVAPHAGLRQLLTALGSGSGRDSAIDLCAALMALMPADRCDAATRTATASAVAPQLQ